MSFSVSFVCDKTPLADPGAIAAYERVLCSTLIYKCAESFCRVSLVWISLWCVCVFVYDEAKGNISIGYCILSSVIIPKLYKKVCDCLLIV